MSPGIDSKLRSIKIMVPNGQRCRLERQGEGLTPTCLRCVLAHVAQACVCHRIGPGRACKRLGCRDTDLSLVLLWGTGVALCFFQFSFQRLKKTLRVSRFCLC